MCSVILRDVKIMMTLFGRFLRRDVLQVATVSRPFGSVFRSGDSGAVSGRKPHKTSTKCPSSHPPIVRQFRLRSHGLDRHAKPPPINIYKEKTTARDWFLFDIKHVTASDTGRFSAVPPRRRRRLPGPRGPGVAGTLSKAFVRDPAQWRPPRRQMRGLRETAPSPP